MNEHKTEIKTIFEPDKVSEQDIEKSSSSIDGKVIGEKKPEKPSENKTGIINPEEGKKEEKPTRQEKQPAEEMGSMYEAP